MKNQHFPYLKKLSNFNFKTPAKKIHVYILAEIFFLVKKEIFFSTKENFSLMCFTPKNKYYIQHFLILLVNSAHSKSNFLNRKNKNWPGALKYHADWNKMAFIVVIMLLARAVHASHQSLFVFGRAKPYWAHALTLPARMKRTDYQAHIRRIFFCLRM